VLPIPCKFTLVAGRGEGDTPLNAFDAALLDAGVGNLNLLRVSSILPPGAVYHTGLAIPPGALVPTAYGYLTSSEPGSVIAAAIGVGFSLDTYGVIMEFEGFCRKEEAEARVTAMVEQGFKKRNLCLHEVFVRAVEHQVELNGSVFAAAVFWY